MRNLASHDLPEGLIRTTTELAVRMGGKDDAPLEFVSDRLRELVADTLAAFADGDCPDGLEAVCGRRCWSDWIESAAARG